MKKADTNREHRCPAMRHNDSVFIKIFDFCFKPSWFLCFVKNQNTETEEIDAHQIFYCPYCGGKA